jgi:shikimate kinase
MSIQAIKGVEIGFGFEMARRRGSQVHDEIFFDPNKMVTEGTPRIVPTGFYRGSNNSGGTEGGMTNGAPLVVRVAMKPISTLMSPLQSVDLRSKQQADASVERSDVCAAPAAAVVGESVVAFELANAFLEKFGGDSLREIKRNYENYLEQIKAFSPLAENSVRNIALTGFMAVGKSAVGRTLARKLGRRFVDLDKIIEQSEGMKVKDIFSRRGESYFRRAEKQALAEVLFQGEQVIATGGGVVIDEENLRLLREKSFLVCLTAAPEVLLRRAEKSRRRPLLEGGDRAQRIQQLLAQREKNYAQAHVAVDTSDLTVEQVVEKIIERFNDGN